MNSRKRELHCFCHYVESGPAPRGDRGAWLVLTERKNIWYLEIIIGFKAYNDYQVFESYNDCQVQMPYIFSLLVSVKADKREKISNWRQTNIFSLLSATQA